MFKTGIFIPVVRKIETVCNGIYQIRYQIGEYETDNEINGWWILANSNVQLQSTIIPKISARTMSLTTNDVMVLDTGDDDTTSTTTEQTSEEDRVAALNAADPNDTQRISDLQNAVEDMYSAYASEYGAAVTESLQGSPIGRMIFVHGMPFQYTYITDRRRYATDAYGKINEANQKSGSSINSPDAYGRTFARNIAANMPIMVLVPGVPSYMSKVSSGATGISGGNKSAVERFSGFWQDLTSSESDSLLAQLEDLGGSYDYFTFEMDMTQYHYYVNALCQAAAAMMGLNDIRVRGYGSGDARS